MDNHSHPTVVALREAVEYAPASGPVSPELRGVLTPDGFYVCAPCVGRLIGRGCGHLIRTARQSWKDEPEPDHGPCVACPANH